MSFSLLSFSEIIFSLSSFSKIIFSLSDFSEMISFDLTSSSISIYFHSGSGNFETRVLVIAARMSFLGLGLRLDSSCSKFIVS
jgi:hypothetical protein